MCLSNDAVLNDNNNGKIVLDDEKLSVSIVGKDKDGKETGTPTALTWDANKCLKVSDAANKNKKFFVTGDFFPVQQEFFPHTIEIQI